VRHRHSNRVVRFINKEINISFIIYLQYLHSKNIKQQNNTLKMHDGRESLAKSSMSSTSNQITLTVYMAAKTGTENQSSKSSKSIQQTKY